jgi:hypothetical protein
VNPHDVVRFSLAFTEIEVDAGKRARSDAAGMATIAGNRAIDVIEPGQSMWGDRRGLNRISTYNWNAGKSPGSAAFAILQEQVVVPPNGVVGSTDMFQEDEAGHRRAQDSSPPSAQ